MVGVRGIRGATTADRNTQKDILDATSELLKALVNANNIEMNDVAAAYFTTTPDLDAEFPAQAARHLGWKYVALMGAQEMVVIGAPDRCIRILLLLNTDMPAHELSFVYLKGAKHLRQRGMEQV